VQKNLKFLLKIETVFGIKRMRSIRFWGKMGQSGEEEVPQNARSSDGRVTS
jgi:hypothetical protein